MSWKWNTRYSARLVQGLSLILKRHGRLAWDPAYATPTRAEAMILLEDTTSPRSSIQILRPVSGVPLSRTVIPNACVKVAGPDVSLESRNLR